MNSISPPVDVGTNTKNAFAVVRTTYENLNKFFPELDAVANQEGLLSITPGYFIRYRSDKDWEYGWMIQMFIKLFQKTDDPSHPKAEGLRQGSVYGVEVSFDADSLPQLYLSRFEYDLSSWTALPTPGQHRWFSWPLWNTPDFEIKPHGAFFVSVPSELTVRKDWGLKRVVFTKIDLVAVNSPEAI